MDQVVNSDPGSAPADPKPVPLLQETVAAAAAAAAAEEEGGGAPPAAPNEGRAAILTKVSEKKPLSAAPMAPRSAA